jgi:hypothetical protein
VNDQKALVAEQKKEALEELARTTVTLARIRKLLLEQESYEPAAFEHSARMLTGELAFTGRRFVSRVAVLVALRIGRVGGLESDSE